MSKPLTMTEQRKADIEHAIDHPSQADMDGEMHAYACNLWDEAMALRAALAAAEAALADERRQLTAALEAERLHADALKEGLAACVGERATFYAGQTQTVTWAVAIEHAERLLSDHRARRAANAPLSDAGASSEVANG